MTEITFFIFLVMTGATFGLWNNLNCPAPRSPENGLSFIFRNGELVHFRCHPGYMMMGKAVAYCVDNHWTAPAPECIRIRKGSRRTVMNPSTVAIHDDSNYYRHEQNDPAINNGDNVTTSTMPSRSEMNKNLFNWDNRSRRKTVYGDGPRRVPIINGIWPGQDIQLMALGPQTTPPGSVDLIREEINIAELRHKQYEEVKKQRHENKNLDLLPPKRRKNKKKDKKRRNYSISNDVNDYGANRDTLISLGTTHDGKALSIARVRPSHDGNLTENDLHRYRHGDPSFKKRRGKGKKWNKNRNGNHQSNNVIARSSRVDTSGVGLDDSMSRHRFKASRRSKFNRNEIQEFRRLPVSHVTLEEATAARSNLASYDTSCVESFYGRDVPMIAPQIANAFVYRYETKKNKDYPFNSYMQVKFKCMNGYMFSDRSVQVLNCKEASWVGEVPKCVPKTG